MVYKKKELPVLVLKLPNGNFKITDLYGKQEELTPEDFSLYVVSEVSTPPTTLTNTSNILEDVHQALLMGDIEGALQIIETQNL